jgi:hypothetical protein
VLVTLILDDRSTTAVLPPAETAEGARGAVAAGLVAIAVVHLLDLPGKSPSYLAWSYVALMLACAVLATAVLVSRHAAVVAAAGALALSVVAAYVLTRTVGLPGAGDDVGNWGEPLGVVALAVETATAWFATVAVVLARRPALRTLRR